MSTPTKERIVDAAMRLFSESGYSGASVAQIEAAAGLSPGAGGLYHHFTSKEEVLAAGIRRHLERLDALRDIRRILSDLGDLRAELSVMARYFLAELDSQADLLRIVVAETRRRPQMLTEAVDQLIATTYQGFSDFLRTARQPVLSQERAGTIAHLAFGSLLSSRLLRDVLQIDTKVDDDALVTTWVEMVTGLLDAPQSRT